MSGAPTTVLAGEPLELLELILGTLLGPVDGYKLPGDDAGDWPVVPTLRVGSSLASQVLATGKVELRDPDTTPLALLDVDRHEQAVDGGLWVAGTLRPLRAPEHGPARAQRLNAAVDFTGRTVMLLRGEVRPADVVRIAVEAEKGPVDLVLEGTDDAAASSKLVGLLQEAAESLPEVRVYYLPTVDAAAGPEIDLAPFVLSRLNGVDVVDLRRGGGKRSGGAVILLTGLSGSGKSTIARALTEHLRAHTSERVVLLDGDHVRAELASELGFSAEDRDRNLRRQAWVGARVAEAGGLAICAPIAPFAATRAAMRAKVEPEYPFLVVHVATPLAVAEQRDRKGLYAKARAGLIKDFTGIDSPYEVPDDADLRVDTSNMSVEESVRAIEELLIRRGLLSQV